MSKVIRADTPDPAKVPKVGRLYRVKKVTQPYLWYNVELELVDHVDEETEKKLCTEASLIVIDGTGVVLDTVDYVGRAEKKRLLTRFIEGNDEQ